MASREGPSLDRFGNETLVTMALKGSEQALGLLLHRTIDSVFTLIYAANGNRAESEGLTALAATEIVSKLRDFRGDTSYSAWQYRIVRKIIAQNLKGRYRHPRLISKLWFEILATEEELIAEGQGESLLRIRSHELAHSILERLPEDHAKLLRLRLIEREPLENAAEHLKIDEDDMLREQYIALRDALTLSSGEPPQNTEEKPEEAPDEAHLLSKAESIHRYIEGLITESPESSVGHQFADEDIRILRMTHIFVFAGVSDFDLRVEPSAAESIVSEGWDKLRTQNARLRAETPVLWGLTRRQIYTSGGISLLALLAIASSVLLPEQNSSLDQQPTTYHGRIIKTGASGFGPLKTESSEVSDSHDSALIGKSVTIKYVWSGDKLPPFPSEVPVQRQELTRVGLNHATSFARRFGFSGEPLIADDEAYIFGEGSAPDPQPDTYRLEINATSGRWSYLLIGSAADPAQVTRQLESGEELPSSERLVGLASKFLDTKGLLAPFFTKPKVEAIDSAGVPPAAIVTFSRRISGYSLVNESGEDTGGETSVVIGVDEKPERADGAVPSNWKSSLYPIKRPAQALDENNADTKPAKTVITVGLTKVRLVYKQVTGKDGAALLKPYYLFRGRVAAVGEPGGVINDSSGERMILMLPALATN